MADLAKVLVGLSALAFVLAVVTNYGVALPLPAASSEGFSRACSNLALLALALVLCFRGERPA